VVNTSNQETNSSDEKTIKEYLKQIISTTLDVLIIANFKEESFSVYDVTEYIKKQFNVVLSSGTLYSTVYTMERQGLLQAFYGNRKRLFKATPKGLHRTNLILQSKEIAAVAKTIAAA
jgi:DNA-binding PadR family transcriptional regulator